MKKFRIEVAFRPESPCPAMGGAYTTTAATLEGTSHQPVHARALLLEAPRRGFVLVSAGVMDSGNISL